MRTVSVVAFLLASVIAQAKPPEPAGPLPALVEKVDALELALNTSELLRAQQAAYAAQQEVDRLKSERQELLFRFATKYRLDADRDHFDQKTLVITRAPKAQALPPARPSAAPVKK